MAKLTIKKRGHSWVLLEGRLDIDAFPTKVRALDEKRRRKLWADEQLRQLQHADRKPTQASVQALTLNRTLEVSPTPA